MRLVLTTLLWLVGTAALAVALPAAWLLQHVVDDDGYAALAQQAAADPALQQAVAAELTARIRDLGSQVDPSMVGAVASQYTVGSTFPTQFAQANRYAHRWLFTDTVKTEVDAQGRWVMDLAPMLSDGAFRETLNSYNIEVPATLPVPMGDRMPVPVRPGELRRVATWGPAVSAGLAVLTGAAALLIIVVARRRGKAIVALGVSALLVGAAGWAGLEVGRQYVDVILVDTSENVRQIAESMVGQAISSMHQWLNLTLAVGGGLAVIGVLVALLGGIGHRSVREPAAARR